jgi:hypothetical protein
MTSIENPLAIRDPFQPPKLERQTTKRSTTTPVKDGVFTNIPR